MEQKVSVAKNYLYNMSYQILLLIVPLITMPHLAKTLGIGNQGTFSVLYSVASVFVMLGCVGLNVYGQREIAYYKNVPSKCNRVFWEIALMRFMTLTVSLAAFLGFSWFNLNVKAVINVYDPLYFLLISLEIIAGMLDISWYYQGVENFKYQTIRNFGVKLISLALILTLVKTENDLWIYIVIYTCSNLAGNGLLWVDRLKTGKFILPRKRSFSRHLKNAFIMFLPQIAVTIYAQLDRVMIGGLLNDGNFQAGVYDNAEKIVKIALTVVTSLGAVMLSRVANTYIKKEQDKTVKYINSSFKLYTCLAVPIMFGIMGISECFVPLFFADVQGAEQIVPVMMVLCPIILFIGGSNVFGTQYLLPTNKMLPYIASVFIGMVVNLIFNFILIPSRGAFGAAAATVIAELTVLIVQLIAVRKTFSVKLYLYAWRNFLSGIVMFICVRTIGEFMGHSILAITLQVCSGVAIYFLLLILLRDRFICGFTDKIFKS